MMTSEANPPQPEVIRATRRSQLTSAVLVILVIASSIAFVFFALPLMTTLPGVSPVSNAPTLFKAMLLIIASLGVLCGAIMIRSGREIMRCGQYPTSDMWLIRDTRVKRGRDAVRMAWVCFISGVLACVWSIGLALYIWMTLERTMPLKLPPGVTIVQQKSLFGSK